MIPLGRAVAVLAAALGIASVAGAAGAPDGTVLAPPQIVLMGGRGRQIAFIAEKSTQTFHVYEWKDGGARLVETLPCTTGKVAGDKQVEGDLKTPEGVYRFLRYISGDQLPPLYGAGALVMDYPNRFDVLARKTGSGIWMHGVETDDRVKVARDTRGCVALRNPDFDRLRKAVRLEDSPIVVVERLQGVPVAAIARDATAMRAFVEDWRRAWESADMDAYLRHYAADFSADGRDLRAWERQKRELARLEGERRIGVDELTVLREKDRWWVTFRQEYAAAGHRDVGMKTLSVRGESPETWRIVGERWRGLDAPFRLIEPDDVAPRLTPALVAAIAPDAAPAPRAAEPPPREQPVRRGAPEPKPAPPEPPVVVAEETPVAPTAPDAQAPPQVPPAATAPGSPPPPAAARRHLIATLKKARADRKTFQLFAPHVQRQGEALYVQVQLLNLRPESLRTGALIVTLPEVEGLPPEPALPEPFAVKQGRLVALTLPDAILPLTIGLAVRDEAGRVVLDQDLVIEAP